MNIPARYCTGYLSDIGEEEPHPPGDFAAWMEVFLGGQWWTFDRETMRGEPRASSSHEGGMPRTCP